MSLKSLLWMSVAVGAASVGLGGTAMAEAAATSAASNATVEEVIVTSDKRPENVQTVPQSVFVATKSVLDRANVRDFDDITSVAPDLTITKTTQPFNNSINI